MNPFAQTIPCERCEDTDYGYAYHQITNTEPSTQNPNLKPKNKELNMKQCPVTHLTINNGSPVVDNQNSMTAGARGPLLAQDL